MPARVGRGVAHRVDGRLLLAGPGTSVYMPRGIPHTFRIESPVARMLDIPAVMAEQTRLGTQVVGPPMTMRAAPGP
jgi:hypothetical protein